MPDAFTRHVKPGATPQTEQARHDQVKNSAGGYTFEVVGSSRVDLQACKLEYSIVSPK